MPINSPIPGEYHLHLVQGGISINVTVRLEEECHKGAKTFRYSSSGTEDSANVQCASSSTQKNNGLDKVIPRSVLERAAGFAIFTFIKAGFVFSARSGSGIVIARLDDGSWSPPSAIGLGGFGFGGQAGAEVTDFLIVLNSRAAVTFFMSTGSLTLGGNTSLAVGLLGRNAEGSGALNTKGKIAAMYSYSKTRELFGGVSVEGSVILERQDANRIAYGGNPTAKQILSGSFDPPEWSYIFIDELERRLERCTASRTAKWRTWEEEEQGEYGNPNGRGSPPQPRSRSGSGGNYAFGDGVGAGGNTTPNRKRSGSVVTGSLLKGDETTSSGRSRPKPSLNKRSSSFNPFSGGSSTPKRTPILSSSESYNAGVTWDSDGPAKQGGRSRSGSVARKQPVGPAMDDLLGDCDQPGAGEPIWKGTGTGGEKDLPGTWGAGDNGLSASFNRLSSSNGNGSPSGRSRSGTTSSRPFDDIAEDEYVPYEAESRFARMSSVDRSSFARDNAAKRSSLIAAGSKSPFGDDVPERKPVDDYQVVSSPSKTQSFSQGPKPSWSVRSGLDGDDGYGRALALYPFQAAAEGDLGLNKGDVLVVLDKVGNGDWWKGGGSNGKFGIFPSSYVEVIGWPKNLKGGVTRAALKARMAHLGFD